MLATGVVTCAFLVGAGNATFSGGDQNAANQFSAGYWAPRHVKLVGTASCAGSTTDVVAVTATIPVGNTIVARLTTRDGAGTAPTAHDSKGNSYQRDAYANANKIDYVIFSARVTTALVSGDTITVTHAGNTKGTVLRVDEFSGIASTNRVYATDTATGKGTSSSVSAPVPTGYAIAIAGLGFKDAATPSEPRGWTILNNETTSCDRALTSVAGYLVTSAAGTAGFASTWSGSRDYASSMVVYLGE